MAMNILISGGSGFIGQALTDSFVEKGHQIFILTRRPQKHRPLQNVHFVRWMSKGSNPVYELPPNIDAVIHLAGASISGGRWTSKRKTVLLKSRLDTTREIVRLIQRMDVKPHVLISASAVAYYGTSNTTSFTESSGYENGDFLTNLVYRWEEAAAKVKQWGVRTVFTRFGLILGRGGGALPLLARPYKGFAGGTIGSGKQWVSWMHIDDLVGLFNLILTTSSIQGPINFTAPFPVQMKEFGKAIGRAAGRPHWLPVPSFLLRILFGEMSLLLLKGQRVLPKKALDHGFVFQYPDIESAAQNLLNK